MQWGSGLRLALGLWSSRQVRRVLGEAIRQSIEGHGDPSDGLSPCRLDKACERGRFSDSFFEQEPRGAPVGQEVVRSVEELEARRRSAPRMLRAERKRGQQLPERAD